MRRHLPKPPAKMEIRRLGIERHPDDHTPSRSRFLRIQRRVAHRRRHALQHHELLRQNLRDFIRRDLEFTRRHIDPIEIRPDVESVQSVAEHGLGAAPTRRAPLAEGRRPRKHDIPKCAEAFRLAESRVHSDDRNRRQRRRPRDDAARLRRGLARLLNQHMGVDAAESKGAHGRAPESIGRAGFPRRRLCRHVKRAARQRDHIPAVTIVRRRRNHAGPHGHQRLDQPRRAGARQQMSDHRLDGADRASPIILRVRLPQRAQAAHFDSVAQRCARSVTLDQFHVAGPPARHLVRRAHRAKLPLAVRRQQASADVIRKTDPANHAVDHVAIASRVIETFQHDSAGAFADDEPIAGRVKRCAHTRARQRLELREPHLRIKAVRARYAAGNHRVAFAEPKRIAGQFHGVEARCAGRVQREGSAAQSQRLGHQGAGQRRRPGVHRIHGSIEGRRLGRADLCEDLPTESLTQRFARHRRRAFRRQRNGREDHADARPINAGHLRIAKRLRPRVDGHRINRIQSGDDRRVNGEAQRVGVQGERVIDETAIDTRDAVGTVADGNARRVHDPASRRRRSRKGASVRDVRPEGPDVERAGKNAAKTHDGDRAIPHPPHPPM